MSLNSLYLDAFYACGQIGNFTKAAQRLHITQSALSQRIRNLEEELGTTLFVREKKGIRLTEVGERLIRYCSAKNAAEADFLAQVQDPKAAELSGIIRLGAFSTVARSIVLPALSDLLCKSPHVQLRLVVRELYELMPLLKSGEIDFLITADTIKKQGLVSHRLGYEKNVLVQKRAYKGAEIFLDHDEEDTTTSDYFGKKELSQFQRRYLDDIYGIIDGVRLGIGKAVVPYHLVSELRDIEILNPSKKLLVPIVIHYYEQPLYSRLHKAVVETLTSVSIA